jgi:hypothetical protein
VWPGVMTFSWRLGFGGAGGAPNSQAAKLKAAHTRTVYLLLTTQHVLLHTHTRTHNHTQDNYALTYSCKAYLFLHNTPCVPVFVDLFVVVCALCQFTMHDLDSFVVCYFAFTNTPMPFYFLVLYLHSLSCTHILCCML